MIVFDRVHFTHVNGEEVLRGIDLSVGAGELVAVVGENGAGKTTLIKHMNGLLRPTTGSVKVFDRDTGNASVADLSRRVGIVFQNADHQLFSDTVENEIAFGLRNFGLDSQQVKRRTDWALHLFGLEPYRNVSPMLLSGGEKKRLCIAAVLAWDPDILVLDEPTVGQDFLQKERLTEQIRMIGTRKKTIIIVSHDIEFIWPLQPRLLVMAGGRVIADGEASSIFRDDSVISKARVTRPQLVELSERLRVKPERPFADVYEGRSWLLKRMG